MRGELLEAARVHSIVGAFYAVHNYFGYGLRELLYAGALEYELIERGHHVTRELAIPVSYKGRHVAWQRIDRVVDDAVIVEIKATEKLAAAGQRQLTTYLRASPFQVGVPSPFWAGSQVLSHHRLPQAPPRLSPALFVQFVLIREIRIPIG